MESVLGLPLPRALEILRRAGIEPRVVRTEAPRAPARTGTERVIRVRGDEVTVALFLDQEPE